jgi:hypothetical protein
MAVRICAGLPGNEAGALKVPCTSEVQKRNSKAPVYIVPPATTERFRRHHRSRYCAPWSTDCI